MLEGEKDEGRVRVAERKGKGREENKERGIEEGKRET